jgi:hypothetical protein
MYHCSNVLATQSSSRQGLLNSTSYSLFYPSSHLNITMNSEGTEAMQKHLGFKGHHIDHILCLLQLASTSKKINHPCKHTALQKLQKFVN